MDEYIIYGTTEASIAPIELHRQSKFNKKEDGRLKTYVNVPIFNKETAIDISWLKSASPKYQVSPNIEDYVLVPVPVVTADIPNRNMQSFPLKSLLDFSTKHGCMRYKTFIGKPTHLEHDNTDITRAKGINFDSALKKVTKYNVVKVFVLSGFDRTKDSYLANAILKKQRFNYSMGAVCTIFRCSICGGLLGPSIRRTCTCYDTCFTKVQTLGRVIHGKLHYHSAVDPVFIENSSVKDPADYTAYSDVL